MIFWKRTTVDVSKVYRWHRNRGLDLGSGMSLGDVLLTTTWAAHWNKDPKPSIWKATAADIIAKVQRGRDALNQIKSTTEY